MLVRYAIFNGLLASLAHVYAVSPLAIDDDMPTSISQQDSLIDNRSSPIRLRNRDFNWIDIDLNKEAHSSEDLILVPSPNDTNINRCITSSDCISTFHFDEDAAISTDVSKDDHDEREEAKQHNVSKPLGRKHDPNSAHWHKIDRKRRFDEIWERSGLGLHLTPKELAKKILQTNFGDLTGRIAGQHIYSKLKHHLEYHAEHSRQKINMSSRLKYAKSRHFTPEQMEAVYGSGRDVKTRADDHSAFYRANHLGEYTIKPFLRSRGLDFDEMSADEIMQEMKHYDVSNHIPVVFFKSVYQLLKQEKGATETDVSRFRQMRKQFRNARFNSRRYDRAKAGISKAIVDHEEESDDMKQD